MKKIEIEARSFISRPEYERLLKKLENEAKFLDSLQEETVYFRAKDTDLRLRRDGKKSYLILKGGKIHDDYRQEIEVEFKKNDFDNIEELFKKIGLKDEIRWFRKRKVYKWKGLKVMLDDTKGYGLIIELEKIENIKNRKKIHKELENTIKNLGIKITPKEVFTKKFEYYKNNWLRILKRKNI